METEILDLNTVAAAADDISVITNTTRVYDDSIDLTPIFTINPTQLTPEAELDPTTESEPDDEDDEGYYYDNEKVEELEPKKEDIPYPILIEINDKDSNSK